MKTFNIGLGARSSGRDPAVESHGGMPFGYFQMKK
jgi:hypothetical protein